MRWVGVNLQGRHVDTVGGRTSQACFESHEAQDPRILWPVEKNGADGCVDLFANVLWAVNARIPVFVGRLALKPKRSSYITFCSVVPPRLDTLERFRLRTSCARCL